MNNNIKEIHDSMNTENMELIRMLTEKISTKNNQDKLLVHVSLKDKIQERGTFIAIVASLFISSIQFAPSISTMIQTLQNYVK